MVLPTGKENEGLGGGVTVFEPFVTVGQILPSDGFLQGQAGFEIVASQDASHEVFWRGVFGKSFVQGEFGRTWSPMVELLGATELRGWSAGALGRRATDASDPQQTAAHHDQRWCSPAHQRAQRPEHAGPDLLPLGLVRWRTLRWLAVALVDRAVLCLAACLLWIAGVHMAVRPRHRDRAGVAPANTVPCRSRRRQSAWRATTVSRRQGGEDVSIGVSWRASMMAHSSRDPYWQAAVRRETVDHPKHAAAIEDECSICHMPMTTYPARAAGRLGRVFEHLADRPAAAPRTPFAADGVSCTSVIKSPPRGSARRKASLAATSSMSRNQARRRPCSGPSRWMRAEVT